MCIRDRGLWRLVVVNGGLLICLAPVPGVVRIGPPVELMGESVEADTARVMAAIVDLLPPEARVAHTPTEAELRSADPNGDLPAT